MRRAVSSFIPLFLAPPTVLQGEACGCQLSITITRSFQAGCSIAEIAEQEMISVGDVEASLRANMVSEEDSSTQIGEAVEEAAEPLKEKIEELEKAADATAEKLEKVEREAESYLETVPHRRPRGAPARR